MSIKFILAAPLVLVVLIFTVQNAGVVDVRFFGWSFAVSLALVIFATLAMGLMAGWILASALRFKKRSKSNTGSSP